MHFASLVDVGDALTNFFSSGVPVLSPNLGPLLRQLPLTLAFGPEQMAGFYSQLPRTTSALFREHDVALVEGGNELAAHA